MDYLYKNKGNWLTLKITVIPNSVFKKWLYILWEKIVKSNETECYMQLINH